MNVATLATWAIAVGATAGVILRPWRLPDYLWACSGAALLVLLGLLSLPDAQHGVMKGADVYLFLTGMMCLAELARQEGLFDWLAARATRLAGGSAIRLFTLVYLVGFLVTVFLSNDATAVVLTPAVAAAARAARVRRALPYLLICAFIANAASFVLPISNPANLVIYGAHMPRLGTWLPRYLGPSAAAVLSTYAILLWTQWSALREPVAADVEVPAFGAGAKMTAAGILSTAGVLMVASAKGWQLGLPTCVAGLVTIIAVVATVRTSPLGIVRGISWGVLPLVAGLFVIVEALNKTGLITILASRLSDLVRQSQDGAAWLSGVLVAVSCNLTNNLPAGLIAGGVLQKAPMPPQVTSAMLIGVDLGPNLSVTGSLATILWLSALRREGEVVSATAFLKLGMLVMTPALLLALAAAII